jgi:hypothetical protein
MSAGDAGGVKTWPGGLALACRVKFLPRLPLQLSRGITMKDRKGNHITVFEKNFA